MSETRNKKIFLKGGVLIVLIFGLALFSFEHIKAIDCDELTGEDKDKCEALEKKAKAYLDLIEIKAKQQNTLKNQMALIDAEQAKNQSELRKTQDQALELSEQINNLQKEIEYKENLIEYQQLILTGLIQSYYENYQEGILKIVLINKDFSDILNKADYVEQSSSRVSEVLRAIQEVKKDLQKEHGLLKEKKEASEKLKKDLENKNLNLQASETQKLILLQQTQGEEKKYQELLEKVREKQRQIEEEIYGIESGKAGLDLGPIPPAKSGLLGYPVNPVFITQNYGKTSFSYNYPTGKHNGIDFRVNYGNIYAAKGGKILATGDNGKYAYGKWIAIDHGNGLVTLYGHLSKLKVSKGNSVKTGEVIAISGNTGFSTGPHLHFSVFAKKTFEIVESSKVDGLMLPTGANLDPRKYL